MRTKSEKILSGVNFDPDVSEYLNILGKHEDRSRSWLINHIIREYAQQHGHPLTKNQTTTKTANKKK